jgi:hypothetical protein
MSSVCPIESKECCTFYYTIFFSAACETYEAKGFISFHPVKDAKNKIDAQ